MRVHAFQPAFFYFGILVVRARLSCSTSVKKSFWQCADRGSQLFQKNLFSGKKRSEFLQELIQILNNSPNNRGVYSVYTHKERKELAASFP